MRATEIIRGLLDLIDKVDLSTQSPDVSVTAIDNTDAPAVTGVDTNRFKHIYAMLDAEKSRPPMYTNSPNTVVADIAAVTTDAGGGWMGPKNPADLKADSITLYPNFTAQPKG
jgi:formate-dependent phosphoribosylglycinamide formyltransferase (GAR transformylase)